MSAVDRAAEETHKALLTDEPLRAAVELALRAPTRDPRWAVTADVLGAIAPLVAARIDDARNRAYEASEQRWSDLIAEFRRMIQIVQGQVDRARGGADAGLLVEAVSLLAARSCETFTSGPGSCTRYPGRFAYARDGASSWCNPCVAWAAVNGVALTHQEASR